MGYLCVFQIVAVVIGFRKQNKRRSLGPRFEGAGTAIAVTGGVSCVKDGTPSEPPYGGPPPSKREARPQMYSLLHKADSHNSNLPSRHIKEDAHKARPLFGFGKSWDFGYARMGFRAAARTSF